MTTETEDIETVSVSFIGGPWDGRTRTITIHTDEPLYFDTVADHPDGLDWFDLLSPNDPVPLVRYKVERDQDGNFVGRVCG